MTQTERVLVRLQHILDNIDGAMLVSAGRTIEAILDDYVAIRATERALQIISEASRGLPVEVRERAPTIPWRNIIGIGNLLRHEYNRLDPAVLDTILKNDLPLLRQAVLRLKHELASRP